MGNRRDLRDRRGTIGVEAAIVMIAFVVVASAVAYVIINMGFYAAQKSKETIGRGVDSASSSLELDGSVVGKVDSSGLYIECLIIPVRLSVGRSQVDLGDQAVMVSVYSDDFALSDMYTGVYQELIEETITVTDGAGTLTKTPILPGSVTLVLADGDGTLTDDGAGSLAGSVTYGASTINYITGEILITDGSGTNYGGSVVASYKKVVNSVRVVGEKDSPSDLDEGTESNDVQLDHYPVKPGSVTITVTVGGNPVVLQDNGDGTLGSGTNTASINYTSGLVTDITIGGSPPQGTVVSDYEYVVSTDPDLDDVIAAVGTEGAMAAIFNDDEDAVLELNEKAFIVVKLDASKHKLETYDEVKVEIKAGIGAALTVVRQIPPGLVADSYVDLG